ncbi:MAG: hypothetical protein WH035_03830 [Spirochaetota bacterium]
MKKIIFIISLILLLSIPIFAQEFLSPFTYISARIYGFGGALTANPTGFEGLFFNPAGYSLAGNNHFGLIDLNIYFNPDFLNLAQATNNFQNLQSSLTEPTFISQLLNMKLGIGLSGLPFIGLMTGGLLIAVYDSAGLSASFIPTIAIPDVKISAVAEAGAVVGYSFKIGNFLYIGANAKIIARAWADIPEQSLATVIDSFSGSNGTLPFDVKFGYGFGFDLGALLKLGIFQVGVSVLNIPGIKIDYVQSNIIDELINGTATTKGTAIIPVQINAGVAMNLGTFIPVIMDKVVLAMDIHSVNLLIQDFSEYGFNMSLFGNYFYFGAEFRTLGLLTIRGGLYQGYPTVGFTLNLFLLKLSFAYYTKELGMFPGTLPESNFIVTLSFSW